MTQNKTIEKDQEKFILSWSFFEVDHYERGWMWYVGVLVFGSLFLLYAVWANNYLFALIILIAVIIIFTYSIKEPLKVNFAISENGIVIGDRFYSYDELKDFWIIYNPPEVKKIIFRFKSKIRPELSINLEDQNPLKIREILLQNVEENLDQEEEFLSEEIARWLKI